MNWFKLTLDKSGAILACEQVAAAEKDGKLTCYMQATTKAEACSAAKEWYRKVKDRTEACRKLRHAARKAAGLCLDCGVKAPESFRVLCATCLEAKRKRDARHRAGLSKPQGSLTAEQVKKNCRLTQKRCDARRVRAGTVLEILDRVGPDALRRWLVELIEKGAAAPPF